MDGKEFAEIVKAHTDLEESKSAKPKKERKTTVKKTEAKKDKSEKEEKE